MQVSKVKLIQFRERMLSEYRESDAFLTFKPSKKNGYLQRDSSIAVLTYILDRGGDKVRWREIRHVFCLGGELRDRTALDTSLRVIELERILERLLIAGFVEREEVPTRSTRTKGRQKPDVYYGIPLVRILFDEMEGGEDLDMDAMRATAAIYDVAHVYWLLQKARERMVEKLPSLLTDDDALKNYIMFWGSVYLSNFSDEEEKRRRQEIAVREWTSSLPDEKRNLRAQVMNYLDAEVSMNEGISPQAFVRPKKR